jgi:FixJ family two-component response regulator
MVTASSDKRHVIEARDAGVSEFLAKPVSAAAIYSHLVRVIEKPRPFVRTRTYSGPCRRRMARLDFEGPDRRRRGDDASASGKDIGGLLERVVPR